jgi:hypothetical protein
MSKSSELDKALDGGLPSHAGRARKPIWEVIDEIIGDVPKSALSRLPTDSAERHDQHLPDSPEKAPRES